MDIEYRLAQSDDLDEIILLVQNSITEMEKNSIFQWDELYPTRGDFAEDISHNSLYLGLYDGKIAVVFALNQQSDEEYKNGNWSYPDREYYVIHRLCVNSSLQKRGIARQTMQFIEEMLRAKKIQAVRLDVFSQNPYAVKLYLHMGYCKVGCADWRKGRFWLMEKYLPFNAEF